MSSDKADPPENASGGRKTWPQIEADLRAFGARIRATMAERSKVVSEIDAAQASVLSESGTPLPFDEISMFRARSERAGLTISRGHGSTQRWNYALDGAGEIGFQIRDEWNGKGRRTILVSLKTYYGSCLLSGIDKIDHAEVLSTLISFLRQSHALLAADAIDFDAAYDNKIDVIFVDDFDERTRLRPGPGPAPARSDEAVVEPLRPRSCDLSE